MKMSSSTSAKSRFNGRFEVSFSKRIFCPPFRTPFECSLPELFPGPFLFNSGANRPSVFPIKSVAETNGVAINITLVYNSNTAQNTIGLDRDRLPNINDVDLRRYEYLREWISTFAKERGLFSVAGSSVSGKGDAGAVLVLRRCRSCNAMLIWHD